MRARPGLLCGVLLGLALIAPVGAQSGPVGDDIVGRATLAIEQGRYGDALDLLTLDEASDEAGRQFLLGELHARGLGVPQNFETALQCFRRAASLGHPAARNALGRAYSEGQAVEADPQLALSYLRAAALSGEARYQADLARALEAGLGGEDGIGEAASWYRQAADQGDLDSLTSLGVLYLEGRGVDRDPLLAIDLFRQASESGDARAQNNLGLIYVRGEDVERDYDRAFQLFSQAAGQGLREGLANLSVMYASGFGVEVDEAESLRLLEQARRSRGTTLSALLATIGFPFDARLINHDWTPAFGVATEQAAEAGDPVALYLTAMWYLDGDGLRQDVPEGIDRLERAARAGLGPAQFALGLIYANGRGLPQDYASAYVWTSLAALAAVPGAIEVRDALAVEMSADQLRGAQQRVGRHARETD